MPGMLSIALLSNEKSRSSRYAGLKIDRIEDKCESCKTCIWLTKWIVSCIRFKYMLFAVNNENRNQRI